MVSDDDRSELTKALREARRVGDRLYFGSGPYVDCDFCGSSYTLGPPLDACPQCLAFMERRDDEWAAAIRRDAWVHQVDWPENQKPN